MMTLTLLIVRLQIINIPNSMTVLPELLPYSIEMVRLSFCDAFDALMNIKSVPVRWTRTCRQFGSSVQLHSECATSCQAVGSMHWVISTGL